MSEPNNVEEQLELLKKAFSELKEAAKHLNDLPRESEKFQNEVKKQYEDINNSGCTY